MADVVNNDAPQTDEAGANAPAPDAGGAAPAPPAPPAPAAAEAGASDSPSAVEAEPPAGTAPASVDGGPGGPGGPDVDVPAPRPSPADEVRPLVHKHFIAPALIPLERVDDDDAFHLRAQGDDDFSALATDLARLGQLFPIDVRLKPPDRFQVITGFRRVAALRFLQREKVLARLHTDLSDADALLMSLAAAIHGREVGRDALEAARERLTAEGRLTPAARDMLAKALASDDELAPESVEEEVDADELAADVTLRLGQCNQDLSLLADVFEELDDARRDELLTQLRYSSELVAYLEGKARR